MEFHVPEIAIEELKSIGETEEGLRETLQNLLNIGIIALLNAIDPKDIETTSIKYDEMNSFFKSCGRDFKKHMDSEKNVNFWSGFYKEMFASLERTSAAKLKVFGDKE